VSVSLSVGPLSHHNTLPPSLAIPGIKLWIIFCGRYEVLRKSAFLSVAVCVCVCVCLCLCVKADWIYSAEVLSEDSLTHLLIPTQRHTLTQYYKQPFMTAASHMWIRMLTLVGSCKALSTDLCDFLWNPDLSFLSDCWFFFLLWPVRPTVVHPASHSSSKPWGHVIFSAVTGSTQTHLSGIKHTSLYLFNSARLSALLTTCDQRMPWMFRKADRNLPLSVSFFFFLQRKYHIFSVWMKDCSRSNLNLLSALQTQVWTQDSQACL